MIPVFRNSALYEFLYYCQQSELPKKVLDCGAGGKNPPVAMFAYYDYDSYGVEIDQEALQKAKSFCHQLEVEVNFQIDDMRSLSYETESFSFVYTYHTIMHLTKSDIQIALNEMKRVLVPEGLMFVNFMSEECTFDKGEPIGNGEYHAQEGDATVIHTFLSERETDKLCKPFEVIKKTKVHEYLDIEDSTEIYVDLQYILKNI